MQQNTAFWYLFNFITREVNSINVILKHLLLETTNKRLGKEEDQFNCFNKRCIQNFGNE